MPHLGTKFKRAGIAFLKSFREEAVIDDPAITIEDEFDDFDSRRLRYNLLWNLYQNTVYRNLHQYTEEMKAQYWLYEFIQTPYNPTPKIIDFHVSHIWPGNLKTAFPLKIDELAAPTTDQLNANIKQAFQWSQWAVNKNVCTLHGAYSGDVFIQVIDDTKRKRVYLSVVNAGKIKDVDLDPFGNVKGYVIKEQRAWPPGSENIFTFTEKVFRDGDLTVFQTFKDNAAFDWSPDDGRGPEWSVEYGFVPMVKIQHINVGRLWGHAEVQKSFPKFFIIDDLTSGLNDAIRMLEFSPHLFAGVDDPNGPIGVGQLGQTDEQKRRDPGKGREVIQSFYATDSSATATRLVSNLPVGEISEHTAKLLSSIEADFPELVLLEQMRMGTGDPSGRAIRNMQKPSADKITTRRVAYDKALADALKMALAIGGEAGYFREQAFNLESFEAGLLDFEIDERPVFKPDRADELELIAADMDLIAAGSVTRIRATGRNDKEILEILKDDDFDNNPGTFITALEAELGESGNG